MKLNCHGLCKVLSQQLPEGSEQYHKSIIQNSRYSRTRFKSRPSHNTWHQY